MQAQILDLDGSIPLQKTLLERCRPTVLPALDWGPGIRLACSFGRFRRFQRALARLVAPPVADTPRVTFCGSGDFHHVSLALLRRVPAACNLLVLDNHPDWMRAIPFLHCGTWLQHASRAPQVRRIFHAGGDVDFDNAYRWLAPWPKLCRGLITVWPAVRSFRRGAWARLPNEPLRPAAQSEVTAERVQSLLEPFAADLRRWPLYVSVDKDVLTAAEATVNWDSGHLHLHEAQIILTAFLKAAGGRLAGMDVVGDWSPVSLRGGLRHLLHWTEHPRTAVDPDEATRRNERVNLALWDTVAAVTASRGRAPVQPAA